MKILVLCTGNSCRSQMAHGFLESFDRNMTVCSAGTRPAERVNPMAVSVMAEVGVDISGHVPTDVSKYTSEEWDYVITVCSNADATCPVFEGKVGKRLHMGFDDPAEAEGTEEEVRSVLVRVRDEIRDAFSRFYITEILKRRMPECSCGE